MWGLAPSGHFVQPEIIKKSDSYARWLQVRLVQPDRAFVRKQVLLGVQRAQIIEQREVQFIKRHGCTNEEAGRNLLFLLQCDLLPGLSGRILENKGTRDSEKVEPVSVYVKLVATVLVVALYVGFLYYVLQYAVTQSKPLQTAWFKSFMLYLVFDFVGLSSAQVLVTHYLVPCVAVRKVTAVKDYLVRRMQRLETEVQRQLVKAALKGNSAPAAGTPPAAEPSFNAAEYLYASFRLSRYLPGLRESQVVRLCGETQSTRQQTLKEIMFGVPKSAPASPRGVGARERTGSAGAASDIEQGGNSKGTKGRKDGATDEAAVPEILGVEVPVGFVYLFRALRVVLVWSLFLARLVLWYSYQAFRPLLVLAVTFPEPAQDLLLDLVAAVVIGGVLFVHIMMYEFFPPLAFLPAFVVLTVTHFYLTSTYGAETTRVAALKHSALQAKAEQRKLMERRLQVEEHKAEQEATPVVAFTAAPPQSAPAVTHLGDGDVSPVHASIKRSSALRASLQRESAKHAAAVLEQMDLSLQRSQSGEPHSSAEGPGGSAAKGRFESRLQHFLVSADKVLQAQQEGVHSRTSPHAVPGGGGSFHSSASASPKHAPSADPSRSHSQTGVSHLRAVDSFYQGKQGTAAPSPTEDSGQHVPQQWQHSADTPAATADTAVSVDEANGSRLVKKATFSKEDMVRTRQHM
jgi:hypothetical protein